MDNKKDFLTLDDVKLKNKSILIRIDVNSPIDPSTKRILDDNRFRSHLKTFRSLNDSKTVILAHQSRPGKKDFTKTEKHAEKLSEILKRDVKYIDDIFGSRAKEEIRKMRNGDILFLENVRFYSEETIERDREKQKDTFLVDELGPLFDFYVNDAFAASHRRHPSIVGFPLVLPGISGKLMEKEIDILKGANKEEGTTYFVLGGAKVDDSLYVTQNLLKNNIADKVFATGILANIFLRANGKEIGEKSLKVIKDLGYKDKLPEAKKIYKKYKEKIELPKDIAILKENDRKDIKIDKIPKKALIQDIGIETIADFSSKFNKADKIIMNGPAGVFEKEKFRTGTDELLRSAAESDAFNIIGGGHICTAAEEAGLKLSFDHVSTGGGALMKFFSGTGLPGLEALKESKKRFWIKEK
ncbi:MAG: 3-phosphoglycerate kinase Pgk [Candidatus Methanohalarchaeum thermophilum]|uniref:Phosphoglycerate kinase n=1 Tax=Methanohalarchaeum thermophilum TaxID=1903181 RepID=A0A1Q6DWQ0_METT1|nr:MAG: 3-phosphoglycerate kinase Pgk [Candidatus Methanohalarchaeum thermophilum]OKY78777.1 MAG: 3-phosphoglycerate kinase Pgk [Candidatus Methanohalarchaeum thermophilum]